MKLKLDQVNKRWTEYALAGCVCILFYVIIVNIGMLFGWIRDFFDIIKPPLIGLIFAYILNPLTKFFERVFFKKIKKEGPRWKISVIFTLLLVTVLLALLLVFMIPQILSSLLSLIDNYQSYLNSLINFIEERPPVIRDLLQDLVNTFAGDSSFISRLGGLIRENALEILQKTTNIGSAAASWVIGAIFTVYFLGAKKSILRMFQKLLSLLLESKKYQKSRDLFRRFNTIFVTYIECELLDALIVGIVNYIFMCIFRMPYALFISAVIGITNLVPTFGPIVGAVIAGFVLLLLKPTALLTFLIFTILLQTADGYIIKPKLFGSVLNVPGVLILIGIIIFGRLWGIFGMLIAIPFVAILVYFYTEGLIPWLERRREQAGKKPPEETEKKEA